MRRIITSVMGVLLLTACGGAVGPGSGEDTAVVETLQDVEYYYACGNETLQLPDGRRFYPFIEQNRVNEDAYLGAPPASPRIMMAAVVLAVPAPDPGDDVGTLTIYEDGTARFVSDSGIETWLTDEEQTYNWVC